MNPTGAWPGTVTVIGILCTLLGDLLDCLSGLDGPVPVDLDPLLKTLGWDDDVAETETADGGDLPDLLSQLDVNDLINVEEPDLFVMRACPAPG